MRKRIAVRNLFILLCCTIGSGAYAQLQITGVTNTPSNCPNSGTITVSATTTNPPIVYSLVSGPAVQPVQTSNVFSSLLPGTYTVQVSDASGAVQMQITTVAGNYVITDFVPEPESPYCDGDSDGTITGNLIPGTGVAPYLWELAAPSPVIVPQQSSNVFTNLPAGNYSVRVTDACNNLRTIAVTLQDPHTEFTLISGLTAEKVGCDSMKIRFSVQAEAYRPPFTFTYQTTNGIFIPPAGSTVYDLSLVPLSGDVLIEQVIPGLTYGDYVMVTVTNDCGNQITSLPLQTYPFVFYPQYSFGLCGNQVSGFFAENIPGPFSQYHTFLNHPVSYTMTEIPSNLLAASGTMIPNNITSGISISTPLTSGHTYHLVMTDGCGETFEHDYTIPTQAAPQLNGADVIASACIDSVVGIYRINTSNFGVNPTMVLLTGPATLGSTKPDYSYTDTYSYPDTISGNSGGYFFLDNLAAGTYTYKVFDDCGNELLGTFTITPQQVTSLWRTGTYETGCPGENKIFYSMTGGAVTVTQQPSGTVIDQRIFPGYGGIYNVDSVLNLSSGTYTIRYEYGESNYDAPINDGPTPCVVIVDTLIIPPYEFPDVSTGNMILCNGTAYLELIADSTKGVAPFQYEIIAGPEIFPLQNSNVFPITLPGNYTVRIYDACGNAAARQVTADLIAFPPPETVSDCSSSHIVFPPSQFDSYTWTAPDGSTFVTDSLVFDPVMPADTGMYVITRIIDINGCTDTLVSEYHVDLANHFTQTISFCPGVEITVGTNIYDTPGTYYDTLPGNQGCDSIVVTVLVLAGELSDTNIVTICSGDSLEIGSDYYAIAGFYTDSIQNSFGCYDYEVTDLRISGGEFSIEQTICESDSIAVGNVYYHIAGIYTDTLTMTSGCDSIVTLDLTVLPEQHLSIQEEICDGEIYILNGHAYIQSGTYTEVFTGSAGCDSTVTLELTVYQLPQINITSDQSVVEPGNTIQLTVATTSSPLSWMWSGNAIFSATDIQNPEATISSSGWLTLTATDLHGCVATDEIYITSELTSTLYVPNSFTPADGTGINDFFHVSYTNISHFEILIFNRWGEVIFESDDVDFIWDGTYKSLDVQDGVYTYKIYAIGIDGIEYDVVGHITLLR